MGRRVFRHMIDVEWCQDQGLQWNESGGLDHLWECQWEAARGEGLCHGY